MHNMEVKWICDILLDQERDEQVRGMKITYWLHWNHCLLLKRYGNCDYRTFENRYIEKYAKFIELLIYIFIRIIRPHQNHIYWRLFWISSHLIISVVLWKCTWYQKVFPCEIEIIHYLLLWPRISDRSTWIQCRKLQENQLP